MFVPVAVMVRTVLGRTTLGERLSDGAETDTVVDSFPSDTARVPVDEPVVTTKVAAVVDVMF